MANKKHFNSFNFIGKLNMSNDESKRLTITPLGSKGWNKHKLQLSVKSGDSSVFLGTEVLMPSDINTAKVFARRKDGEGNLDIPFESRNEEFVLDNVADFNKLIVDMETSEEVIKERLSYVFKIRNLENREELSAEDAQKLVEYKEKVKELSGNRHEFIHMYDVIQFLNSKCEEVKKLRFKVAGNVMMSESKGKYYTNFEPKAFYVVTDEEVGDQLEMDLDIYFDKDSVTENKKEANFELEGWLMNRDNFAKEDRYYPKTFIMHKQGEEDGVYDLFKEFVTVKGKNAHHLRFKVDLVRGAEKKEATMDDLTASQRKLVLAGVYNAEDFLKGKNVYGENVEEWRLSKPELSGAFEDGAEDTELSVKEFGELIAVSTGDKKLEDVKVKKEDNARVMDVKPEDVEVKESDAARKLREALGL